MEFLKPSTNCLRLIVILIDHFTTSVVQNYDCVAVSCHFRLKKFFLWKTAREKLYLIYFESNLNLTNVTQIHILVELYLNRIAKNGYFIYQKTWSSQEANKTFAEGFTIHNFLITK